MASQTEAVHPIVTFPLIMKYIEAVPEDYRELKLPSPSDTVAVMGGQHRVSLTQVW